MGVNDAREQLEVAEAEVVRLEAAYENLARLHEVATERTVQLAAVIEKAKRSPYHSVTVNGRRTDSVYDVLAAADTDAALRELRAKAWDEGYDFRSTLPPYHIGGPSENPYGEGE